MDPIAELEKRIEESKRLVIEQENALAVLKKAFGVAYTSAANTTKPQKVATDEVFNFNDLILPEVKRNTFNDDIRAVIGTFGKNEFTVLHVEAALIRRGIEIKGKSPRARISLSLAKLVEENFVGKVFEGSGNVPHRYLLKGESPVDAGLSSVTMSLAG